MEPIYPEEKFRPIIGFEPVTQSAWCLIATPPELTTDCWLIGQALLNDLSVSGRMCDAHVQTPELLRADFKA